MKSFIAFFLIAGCFCRVVAGEQQIKLAGDPFGNWKTNGSSVSATAGSTAVVLSAGAEISRSPTSGMIAMHLVTRPYFSAHDSDWPILMVGSVALIFRKDGICGQIVLVGSDGQLREVANSVPLDANALSGEPLDMLLAYDPAGGIGFVGIGSELRSFQGAGTVAMDTVISAGAYRSWKIDSLEVQPLDQKQGEQDKKASSADVSIPKPSTELLGSIKTFAAVQKFLGQQNLLSVPPLLLAAITSPVKDAKRSSPELEIFTPPSVRFLSAAAVRALAARLVQK